MMRRRPSIRLRTTGDYAFRASVLVLLSIVGYIVFVELVKPAVNELKLDLETLNRASRLVR